MLYIKYDTGVSLCLKFNHVTTEQRYARELRALCVYRTLYFFYEHLEFLLRQNLLCFTYLLFQRDCCSDVLFFSCTFLLTRARLMSRFTFWLNTSRIHIYVDVWYNRHTRNWGTVHNAPRHNRGLRNVLIFFISVTFKRSTSVISFFKQTERNIEGYRGTVCRM